MRHSNHEPRKHGTSWPTNLISVLRCFGFRVGSAHATATHRGQLEDVQDRRRDRRVRQGAARARSRTCAASTSSIAPPFTALHAAAEAARNSNIAVGAQNLHWERDGAFTGEVSAAMVREAGAELRDRRPLRAPHAVRRHRRDRQPEDARGAGRRPRADRLRRRDARRSAIATRRWRCSIGRSRRASTASPASSCRAWCWPTSRCGRSAPAATPRRRRPARRTPTSAQRLEQWFGARRGRAVPRASTAAA